MPLATYLKEIETARQSGDATEHTHRPALKELLEALGNKITALGKAGVSAADTWRYLGDRIERATAMVLKEQKVRTYDLGGSATTTEMAEAIAAHL